MFLVGPVQLPAAGTFGKAGQASKLEAIGIADERSLEKVQRAGG